MVSLMDTYSDQEFKKIVQKSYSYSECLKFLGYNSNSGDSTNRLKEKIKEMNIDISHFSLKKEPIKRNRENVFCKNSSCNQHTLRNWYLKENLPYVCTICGQIPIWNNKPLTLILDHINGKNNDNELSNLRWVCPNCNIQLETTNARNPNKKQENNYCVTCGKRIPYQNKRCSECREKYGKYISHYSHKELPVNREELKNLIRNNSFKKLGEQFKVSDNAIRKWCKKYNLPFKTSDIKNLSDSEWKEI